ncbi:HPr family phosphocarrier protein [Brachyspira hampsonii]|nr:HPr family phosphocarrier protein [Brachyspira hampsonii]
MENESGKTVNASSLLKVLSLGIGYISAITIYCYKIIIKS